MLASTYWGAPLAPLNYSDIYNLALNAGFAGDAAHTMTAIALAESSGVPNVVNPNDRLGSFGLTQINEASHPGLGAGAIDPQTAMNDAFSISNGGTNFTPWSSFNHNLYQKFLQTSADIKATAEGASGSGTLSFDPNQPPTTLRGLIDQAGGAGGILGGPTQDPYSPSPRGAGGGNWLSDLLDTLYGWFQRTGIIVVGLVLLALGGYAMLHGSGAPSEAKP
jgi:Lysozyme like domain